MHQGFCPETELKPKPSIYLQELKLLSVPQQQQQQCWVVVTMPLKGLGFKTLNLKPRDLIEGFRYPRPAAVRCSMSCATRLEKHPKFCNSKISIGWKCEFFLIAWKWSKQQHQNLQQPAELFCNNKPTWMAGPLRVQAHHHYHHHFHNILHIIIIISSSSSSSISTIIIGSSYFSP